MLLLAVFVGVVGASLDSVDSLSVHRYRSRRSMNQSPIGCWNCFIKKNSNRVVPIESTPSVTTIEPGIVPPWFQSRVPEFVGRPDITRRVDNIGKVEYFNNVQLYPMGNLDLFCQSHCHIIVPSLRNCETSVCTPKRFCSVTNVPCHYAWIHVHETIMVEN